MTKVTINTMEELSRAIGVSRPTLSRYFQDPSSVKGSTSTKIRAGLERVDYVPNFFATRLNRKTTGLIGVIVPHLNDLFYTSLLDAIQRTAMAADFTIITQTSRGDPVIEANATEKLIAMNVDGALVAPLGTASSIPALERLAARLPVAFVDSQPPRAIPQVDFIGTDNSQSIGLILDYLCRTGEPPAFLVGPKLNSNAAGREAAYIDGMIRRGLDPLVIDSAPASAGWDFETYAHDVMDGHFGRGDFRDRTLLCSSDRLAIGALRAANRHGLFARGGNFRIAGHDDHPLSRFMTPALTTVTQNIDAIAAEAIRVLHQRIAQHQPLGASGLVRTFPATLQVRESA